MIIPMPLGYTKKMVPESIPNDILVVEKNFFLTEHERIDRMGGAID
jgi:hypothetical protein